MGRVIVVAFVLLRLGGCARAAAASLTEKVSALAQSHAGKVALYAENLATHQQVTVNADEAVQTASVIKLSILYHVLLEVRAGRARWNERIALRKDDQVAGSGVLLFFDTPLSLTLHDVVSMMIDVSDNTATNLLIDRFGIEAINRDAEAIGRGILTCIRKYSSPPPGCCPPITRSSVLGKRLPGRWPR
jgi:beta-lactamase class A